MTVGNPPPPGPLPPRPAAAGRVLRARYAAVGVLMAASWISARGEPLWGHALRTLLVVLTIPALVALDKRRGRRARPAASAPQNLVAVIGERCALIAAALGLSWLIGYLIDPSHASWLSPVVLFALLVATIPLQVRAARRIRAAMPGADIELQLSMPRLFAAKVVLLAAALALDWALSRSFAQADLVIGVALFMAVAWFGPRVHHLLLAGGRHRTRARHGLTVAGELRTRPPHDQRFRGRPAAAGSRCRRSSVPGAEPGVGEVIARHAIDAQDHRRGAQGAQRAGQRQHRPHTRAGRRRHQADPSRHSQRAIHRGVHPAGRQHVGHPHPRAPGSRRGHHPGTTGQRRTYSGHADGTTRWQVPACFSDGRAWRPEPADPVGAQGSHPGPGTGTPIR